MFEKLAVGSLMLLAMACSSPEPKSETSLTPGLRKVAISSPQDVDRLRQLGVDIIVCEDTYLVIRQDNAQVRQLQDAGITTMPIQETDLVQRLVRIHFSSREQLQQIIDIGVDFWEQEGDSLTARAYDIHLERLQAAGIGYHMLAKDASKREGGK